MCWKEMHFEVGTQKFTLGSMPRPVLYFCTIMLVLYVKLSCCLFAFFPPIHRCLADIVQDPQGIWLCLPLHPTEDTKLYRCFHWFLQSRCFYMVCYFTVPFCCAVTLHLFTVGTQLHFHYLTEKLDSLPYLTYSLMRFERYVVSCETNDVCATFVSVSRCIPLKLFRIPLHGDPHDVRMIFWAWAKSSPSPEHNSTNNYNNIKHHFQSAQIEPSWAVRTVWLWPDSWRCASLSWILISISLTCFSF